MSNHVRKLRGVLGIGLTWAASWTLIGVGLGFLRYVTGDRLRGLAIEIVNAAVPMAVTGLLCGLGFGVVLALTEYRNTVRDLKPGRAAVWGLVGSALIPVVYGDLQLLLITGSLGAVFASASVAVARSSELKRLARTTPQGLAQRAHPNS